MDTAPEWLVERIENLISDVRNGQRVDAGYEADEIVRYLTEEV